MTTVRTAATTTSIMLSRTLRVASRVSGSCVALSGPSGPSGLLTQSLWSGVSMSGRNYSTSTRLLEDAPIPPGRSSWTSRWLHSRHADNGDDEDQDEADRIGRDKPLAYWDRMQQHVDAQDQDAEARNPDAQPRLKVLARRFWHGSRSVLTAVLVCCAAAVCVLGAFGFTLMMMDAGFSPLLIFWVYLWVLMLIQSL